jgi:pimeloyl-ACP methyl ester carboxylesterase
MKSNSKNKSLKTELTLIIIFGLTVSSILAGTATTKAATGDGWTLTKDNGNVKAYPDLRESIWQKNALMAPNGPYDKIGLHRLVKANGTAAGCVFLIPGMSDSGEDLISNPPNDNWTKTENNTQAIYWANRGFDVYSIDYRSHFVPSDLNSSQVSFMADWGWDQYISDINEAVTKAKVVSGFSKVFLVGYTEAGMAAMNYATLYGKNDVKGIMILDGIFYSTPGLAIVSKRGNETNTYNLTQAISVMKSAGNWSKDSVGTGGPALYQYAANNPGAPAQYPPGTPLNPPINPMTNRTWTNITEWVAYYNYYAYGPLTPGFETNIFGGYGDLAAITIANARHDRIYPARLSLETSAMADWMNCPYLTNDFDDNYSKVDVPILAFAGGLSANVTRKFSFVNGTASRDFQGIVLAKYGFYDIQMGIYSARDVSAPACQWMLERSLTSALAVTPSSGPAGSTVQIVGSGYTAATTVTVQVGGVNIATAPAQIQTTTGSFIAYANIPAGLTGNIQVTAADARYNSAQAAFVVTPVGQIGYSINSAALAESTRTTLENGKTAASFVRGSSVRVSFVLQTSSGEGNVVWRVTWQRPDLAAFITSSSAYAATAGTIQFSTILISAMDPPGTWTAIVQIYGVDGFTAIAVKSATFIVT